MSAFNRLVVRRRIIWRAFRPRQDQVVAVSAREAVARFERLASGLVRLFWPFGRDEASACLRAVSDRSSQNLGTLRRWMSATATLASAIVAGSVITAGAQTQPPTANDVPQRTTAAYADWIVQCETNAGPPAQKLCEMGQTTQVQGKNLPFSRVAVGHPEKGRATKLVVLVPVNASFATNVRVQTADNDPGLAAPFARCVPNGCVAEFELKDDVLKRLRAASGVGKVSFADAGGHQIDIPLSFKGFNQAFEALSKE
jgi:invasion protein IalB